MESVTITPLIYVLELEQEKYYIGITYNLNLRYAQHLSGSGAKWTRLYKPMRIVEIIVSGASLELENATTLRYKELYGHGNVRGGSWCKV